MPMLPVKGNRSMIYGSDAGQLPILDGERMTEKRAQEIVAGANCEF